MHTKLQVRRYDKADYQAVWNLHNIALHQVNAHAGNGAWDDDLHNIEHVYLDAGGEFLVGEVDGVIVAMGALLPVSNKIAEVKRMRVNPEHQRRGYGECMLNTLLEKAKERGFKILRLDTTVGQIGAQRLYEKSGFMRVGTASLAGFDCYLYERDI